MKRVIDTPEATDGIVSVCDKLLSSLRRAETNARDMLARLGRMTKIK
jgi:hypothetical protein